MVFIVGHEDCISIPIHLLRLNVKVYRISIFSSSMAMVQSTSCIKKVLALSLGIMDSVSGMISSSMFVTMICLSRLELFSSQRNCVLGEQVLVSSVSNNIIVYNKS